MAYLMLWKLIFYDHSFHAIYIYTDDWFPRRTLAFPALSFQVNDNIVWVHAEVDVLSASEFPILPVTVVGLSLADIVSASGWV